jgi:O-antigen ligase
VLRLQLAKRRSLLNKYYAIIALAVLFEVAIIAFPVYFLDTRYMVFAYSGLAIIGATLGAAVTGRLHQLGIPGLVLATGAALDRVTYQEPLTGLEYGVPLIAIILAILWPMYVISPKDEMGSGLSPQVRQVFCGLLVFTGVITAPSLVTAINPTVSLYEAGQWVLRAGAFLLMFRMLQRHDSVKIFIVSVCCVVVLEGVSVWLQTSAGYNLYNALVPQLHTSIEYSEGVRASGLFGGYTSLALYLSVLLPFLVGASLYATASRQYALVSIMFLSIAVGTYGLFQTFYRTSWIAVTTAILTQGILLSLLDVRSPGAATKFRVRFRTVVVIASFVLIFYTIYSLVMNTPELQARFSARGDTVASRMASFGDAISMFSAHPVLGIGLRNYRIFMFSSSPGLWGYLGEVHNSYLLILAETGLLGFGMFVVLIGLAIRALLSVLKNGSPPYPFVVVGALGSLVAFMVDGIGVHAVGYHNVVNILFLLIAAGISCQRV